MLTLYAHDFVACIVHGVHIVDIVHTVNRGGFPGYEFSTCEWLRFPIGRTANKQS